MICFLHKATRIHPGPPSLADPAASHLTSEMPAGIVTDPVAADSGDRTCDAEADAAIVGGWRAQTVQRRTQGGLDVEPTSAVYIVSGTPYFLVPLRDVTTLVR